MEQYQEAILGTILQVDREEQQKIFSTIPEEQFLDPILQAHYSVMKTMFNENKPVDIVGFPDEARKNSWYSLENILEYINSVPACSMWTYYASQMEREFMTNQLKRMSIEFAKVADTTPPEEALHFMKATLDSLKISDSTQNIQDFITENADKPPAQRITWTEIPMLDNTVKIAYQHLDLIAARPSVGKTTLMCNLAMRAPEDKKVIIFSMEQPAHELMDIMCANKLTEPIVDVANNRNKYWKKIKNKNIFIDDTTKRIEKMELKVINLQPDLILIDNLQCFDLSRDPRKKAEVLQDYCYRLKELAKSYHCGVILLCQLNRNFELTEREPVMSDIRDSGGAEMAADVILTMFEKGMNYSAQKDTWIKVIKNRGGEKDTTFKLDYNKMCGRIS